MPDPPTRFAKDWPLLIAAAVQLLFVLVLRYEDIGFDRAGRFGFDFADRVVFLLGYLAALAVGVGLAAWRRAWWAVATQIVLPLALVAWDSRPPPRYDAADHRHLVGKTRAEVEGELSDHLTTRGIRGDGQVTTHTTGYHGMTVHYDGPGDDAVVVGVEDF